MFYVEFRTAHMKILTITPLAFLMYMQLHSVYMDLIIVAERVVVMNKRLKPDVVAIEDGNELPVVSMDLFFIV
jgi:hypothetical protein